MNHKHHLVQSFLAKAQSRPFSQLVRYPHEGTWISSRVLLYVLPLAPPRLSLDLQVHGQLGTKTKHRYLKKSHAEIVSPPSYPVLSMFYPFLVTRISAGH